MCVHIKDINRRLALALQCSLYQCLQGDVNQSVRGNDKSRFLGRQNVTAVEGNASVYQVYPISRITGEERADIIHLPSRPGGVSGYPRGWYRT